MNQRIALPVVAGILFIGIAFTGTALGFGADSDREPEPARPNVVLVMTDDQGYGDFGFTGNESVSTPHLDAMAERSARFSTFYVTPVCATTRATLLTGRYHPYTGVVTNRFPMKKKEVTLAERLQEAGYATAIFGKWHLGSHLPRRPTEQGFDTSLVFRGGILRELEDEPVDVRYTDPRLIRNGELIRAEGYATDIFFDAALDWIETVHAEGKSFFAFLSTNAPHLPYSDVPAEAYARYLAAGHDKETAAVYAMVSRVDENVGKLFERLTELDLIEETLILFLSDNGPTRGRFNAGLAQGKGSVREGGIRVPFLAHWPGALQPRLIPQAFGAHIDVVPTILEACGIEPDGLLMGRSLMGLLKGAESAAFERSLFFHAHSEGDFGVNYAVRTPEWKLVHDDGFSSLGEPSAPLLFHMPTDALEGSDVAADHPDVVALLEEEYSAWRAGFSSEVETELAGPPIRLGDKRERPVLLTRSGDELEEKHWKLKVVRDGVYRFELRFPAATSPGQSNLRLRTENTLANPRYHRERSPFRVGTRRAVYEDIVLSAGEWTLNAELLRHGKPSEDFGVWQVEISW